MIDQALTGQARDDARNSVNPLRQEAWDAYRRGLRVEREAARREAAAQGLQVAEPGAAPYELPAAPPRDWRPDLPGGVPQGVWLDAATGEPAEPPSYADAPALPKKTGPRGVFDQIARVNPYKR